MRTQKDIEWYENRRRQLMDRIRRAVQEQFRHYYEVMQKAKKS